MSEEMHFSRVLHQDDDKAFQWRVAISEFRGVQYLSIRKFFLSFEGEWLPSKEGATLPLTINTTLKLFLGLSEILSEAEISRLSEELQLIVKEYKDEIPF